MCFLWSESLAVWNILSSPISCKSFKVSALTIWIVGASVALSLFPFSCVRFERFPDALFDEEFSLGEVSSSCRRDGKHPIMRILKHSFIFPIVKRQDQSGIHLVTAWQKNSLCVCVCWGEVKD